MQRERAKEPRAITHITLKKKLVNMEAMELGLNVPQRKANVLAGDDHLFTL